MSTPRAARSRCSLGTPRNISGIATFSSAVEIGQQVVRLEYEAKMLLAEGRQLTLVEFADGYAADSHAAARRFFHAGQLVEQRGFAGAGFAENAADLALRDTEIDTVKRHHRLILDGVFLA